MTFEKWWEDHKDSIDTLSGGRAEWLMPAFETAFNIGGLNTVEHLKKYVKALDSETVIF